MRTAFIESLIEAAERDETIWLLNADLGYSVLEAFEKRFPDRYLNVGVAEQNMIGIAAGLAMSGFKVFVYSIANFPTLRCLEQIRVDVCYHQAHVIIAAVGGGFAYGSQGYTHHAIEDLAVMRALPGMRVTAPRALVNHLIDTPGPAYLRLGRAGEKNVHEGPLKSSPVSPIVVRDGNDLVIVSTGAMLVEAVMAADRLDALGVRAKIISLPMLKPLDEEALLASIAGLPLVVTLEEHSKIGGLRDTIAPLLASMAAHPRLLAFGVEDGATFGAIFDQDGMRQHCGISADQVVKGITEFLS